MFEAVIFGGTTEGRRLCETASAPVLYCVATPDGARAVENLPNVRVRVGRLDADEMAALLCREKPAQAVDATHPYAVQASRNIALACKQTNVPLKRVARESSPTPDCRYFPDISMLLAWLEETPGNIFATTGSSAAEALVRFKERVWLRVLPNTDSLRACLSPGYRPDRIICMQGPFSEELNRAMFKAAGARILVTKDSGAAGGFPEKIRAAKSLDMLVAVLERPRMELKE